jgi:hypothetical protein
MKVSMEVWWNNTSRMKKKFSDKNLPWCQLNPRRNEMDLNPVFHSDRLTAVRHSNGENLTEVLEEKPI